MSETQAPLNQQELDLEYTKAKRKKIVEDLLGKPADKLESKDLSIALQALDGIDRQALTLTRIKSDEGINNSAVTAAAALVQLYMTPRSKKPKRVLEEGEVRTMPALPPSDVPVEILAGEFEAGVKGESYDEFQKRTKGPQAA